jgi:Ca-activated chloride channel homolog
VSLLEWGHPSVALFFTLPFLFIILIWYWLRERELRITAFLHSNYLGVLFEGFSFKKEWFRQSFFLLAFFFSIFALIDPKVPKDSSGTSEDIKNVTSQDIVESEEKNIQEVVRKKKAHDIIFLLDASASMSVSDMRSNMSRFEFAKEVIDETVRLSKGENVALYTFTSEVTPSVPLTLDTLYLRLLLPHVKINEGDVAGTDFFALIDKLATKHRAFPNKRVTLVLLSDGGDTYLESLGEGDAKNKQVDILFKKVDAIASEYFTLYTVGLGSHKGAIIPDIQFNGSNVTSTLDEALLKGLSKHGNGSYYFAQDLTSYSVAENIWNHLSQKEALFYTETSQENIFNIERHVEGKEEVEYLHFFQIPLGLSILFLILEYLFPYLVRKESYV